MVPLLMKAFVRPFSPHHAKFPWRGRTPLLFPDISARGRWRLPRIGKNWGCASLPLIDLAEDPPQQKNLREFSFRTLDVQDGPLQFFWDGLNLRLVVGDIPFFKIEKVLEKICLPSQAVLWRSPRDKVPRDRHGTPIEPLLDTACSSPPSLW